MKKPFKNLSKRLFLLSITMLFGSMLWAQIKITGTVLDENSQAIPGVAVILQGTSTGTITNTNGIYSITAPADGVLEFSFVGNQTVVEAINNRTTINVILKPSTYGLTEIVAIGYGVQRKATLTGSVGNVKAEEMTLRPAANTTELLQGQVAGLITQQASGLPGEDGTILNIRGFGDDPLVLIDGIESELSQVDPNDVESVSVLKDASAAIYGARAGNGVIIVTTKRGKAKEGKITYHGNISFSQPTFLPKLVEARKWAELLDESGLNPDNYSPKHLHYDPVSKRLINTLDNSDFKGYDWGKALYRSWAPQQQHNIGASGGTEKIKYFLSVGFTDQESAFKSGDYDFNRYNVRSNIDAEITKGLSISLNLSYRNTILDKANFGLDPMYTSLLTAKPVYPIIHEADPERAASSGFLQRSPYYQSIKKFTGYQEYRDYALQGSLELRYSFQKIDGLVAKARINYEQLFSWDKTVNKPFDVWEYDPIAANAGNDPWIHWGTQNSNDMSVYSDRATQLLPLITLEYTKSYREHNFKTLIVSETQTNSWTSLLGTRKNILSFEAPYLDFASEEGKDNAENYLQSARSSIIGRVNYNYAGKYLLEIALRADASAEYPPESRWGYFPNISAGWRISDEAFIKDNIESIDNLKIRGSYGILGNDAISSFDYLTGYSISTDFYIYGTTPAPLISSTGLSNPNITWETMKISNIGLDGNFWNGLLGFEVDAFYRLREGILALPNEQVPSTFGASLPQTNLNKRDNRGIEILLNHYNKIGDFSYDITPMFSWSRGKYVELQENALPVSGDIDEDIIQFNRQWNNRYLNEGQWDDRVWGYSHDGFFMNQQQIDEHKINQDQAENQTLKVGDFIYKDLNGDNLIDWRDQKVIGKSGIPKTMYSLDMGAKYRNFSLRMLWQGATDYIVTISGGAAAPFVNESIPIEQHYKYRAKVAQDANGKDYITNPDIFKLPPVTQNGSTSNNSQTNDFWTYNASFLRLKNINISYSLPKALLNDIGIESCIIYFSGTNLFAISNLGIWKDSYDPEIAWANNMHYPPVKTATFGLKLTL